MYQKIVVSFMLLLSFFIYRSAVAGKYRPGEVIVELKNGGFVSSKIYGSANIKRLSSVMPKKFSYILLKSSKSVSQMTAELKNNPNVLKVSPNYIRRAMLIPNDPDFSDQWGLYNTGQTVKGLHETRGISGADIDAPDAWNISTGKSNVVVADIDSGINYNHPDLKANVWKNPGEIPGNGIDDDHNGYIDDVYGIDTVNGDSDPMDDEGHGTYTAGIIAAVGDNNIGVAGVTWKCKIMAIKALDSEGIGTDADIIEAINYIIDMKKNHSIDIVAINASFGGYGNDSILKDAINAAGNAGIVFISAAGNESNDNDINPSYPASYNLPNIISVAASNSSDAIAAFSNYGKSSVELMAPGVNILSTYYDSSGDQYAFADGTSAASPFVAGAIALDASVYPDKSPSELINSVISGADKIAADKVSGGMLNLYGMLTSNNAPPIINSLTALKKTKTAPFEVAFSVSASDSDGIKQYDWDFNSDGITDQVTSSPTAAHIYSQEGTYTATVRVVDNLGARTYKNISITLIKKIASGSSGSAGTKNSGGNGGSGGGCSIGKQNYIGFSLPLFLLLSAIYLFKREKIIRKIKNIRCYK